MNLIASFCFCFLTLATESFYIHDATRARYPYVRAMPTGKRDNFLSSTSLDGNLAQDEQSRASLKRIILIRHGRTFMNELIGGGGIAFGQPNFTDIFHDQEDQKKYHDSPLSDVGTQQAKSLYSKLKDLQEKDGNSPDNFFDDLDLVVVSPLTRALETLEQSLYGHIAHRIDNGQKIPIVSVAAAAERLYLVSDLGKPRSELRSKYPFVDFDSAFSLDCSGKSDSSASSSDDLSNEEEVWHFSPTKQVKDEYREWRPHGEGQEYACLGEPSAYFDRRMSNFYYWLESREEKCIAIVCHAGVIDWLTSGEQFANCELRIQSFDCLQPRALQKRIS